MHQRESNGYQVKNITYDNSLTDLFRDKKISLVLICTFLLGSLTLLQHYYVKNQINKTYKQRLVSYANQIQEQLVIDNKWQLDQFRRAAIQVPQWSIIEDTKLLIDVEGTIPDFYDKVEVYNNNIFDSPQNLVTDTGEEWRLLGLKLIDGYVVVGIKTDKNSLIYNTDSKLRLNSSKFSPSVEKAKSINSKDIDYSVDYAV